MLYLSSQPKAIEVTLYLNPITQPKYNTISVKACQTKLSGFNDYFRNISEICAKKGGCFCLKRPLFLFAHDRLTENKIICNPKNKQSDIYFIYNVLKNINYTPANHERHWISIFSQIDVLVPKSYEEQTIIGNYFRKINTLIEQETQTLNQLKSMKVGLLQQMFI